MIHVGPELQPIRERAEHFANQRDGPTFTAFSVAHLEPSRAQIHVTDLQVHQLGPAEAAKQKGGYDGPVAEGSGSLRVIFACPENPTGLLGREYCGRPRLFLGQYHTSTWIGVCMSVADEVSEQRGNCMYAPGGRRGTVPFADEPTHITTQDDGGNCLQIGANPLARQVGYKLPMSET